MKDFAASEGHGEAELESIVEQEIPLITSGNRF
jgi:hypothetical protein